MGTLFSSGGADFHVSGSHASFNHCTKPSCSSPGLPSPELWAPGQWTVDSAAGLRIRCLLTAAGHSPQRHVGVHPETWGCQTESFRPAGPMPALGSSPALAAAPLASEVTLCPWAETRLCVSLVSCGSFFVLSRLWDPHVGGVPSGRYLSKHQQGLEMFSQKSCPLGVKTVERGGFLVLLRTNPNPNPPFLRL